MRQFIIPVIFVLFTYAALAQEVVKVSKNDYNFREEYTVLASDKNVKHGGYKRYSVKNELTIDGNYENDRKTGEWKFYQNGVLLHAYNYSTKKLTSSKASRVACFIEDNGVVRELILDSPPMYLGSKSRLNEELLKVMKYPLKARRMGIEGIVTASVWVDPNGDIEVKILKGILPECDNELLNGLKVIDKDWIPGALNGVAVKAQYIVSLEYLFLDEGKVDLIVR